MRHFIFTRTARPDRAYGGENYKLTVYEFVKRGELNQIGTVSKNTRGHKGELSEAWGVIWNRLTTRQQLAMLRKAKAGMVYNFPGYFSHHTGTVLNVKIDQL